MDLAGGVFDLTSLLKGMLQAVPVWCFVLIVFSVIWKRIEKFIAKLDKRMEQVEKSLTKIDLELAGAHLSEVRTKLEHLQMAKAELSADMHAVWTALEALNPKPKASRAKHDRDN